MARFGNPKAVQHVEAAWTMTKIWAGRLVRTVLCASTSEADAPNDAVPTNCISELTPASRSRWIIRRAPEDDLRGFFHSTNIVFTEQWTNDLLPTVDAPHYGDKPQSRELIPTPTSGPGSRMLRKDRRVAGEHAVVV